VNDLTQRKNVPVWSTRVEGCRVILSGVTFNTCARVALVVGSILSVVNQGGVIMDGDATWMTWARVAVNYLIPFLVSSVGYIAPFRLRDEPSS
jgi:hypothetical protein